MASRLRQPGYTSGFTSVGSSGGSPHYAPPGYSAGYSPTYPGAPQQSGSPYMAYAPHAPMMAPMGIVMGGGSPVMMMAGGGSGMVLPPSMGDGGYGMGSGGYGMSGEDYNHLGERGAMLDLMSGAFKGLPASKHSAFHHLTHTLH